MCSLRHLLNVSEQPCYRAGCTAWPACRNVCVPLVLNAHMQLDMSRVIECSDVYAVRCFQKERCDERARHQSISVIPSLAELHTRQCAEPQTGQHQLKTISTKSNIRPPTLADYNKTPWYHASMLLSHHGTWYLGRSRRIPKESIGVLVSPPRPS